MGDSPNPFGLTSSLSRSFGTGFITLWYGDLNNIPESWALCNGENGTPDLRNDFVVGAGDTYAVGANGGNINHNHTFTGDGHSHTMRLGVNIGAVGARDQRTSSTAATGTTDNTNGLPPYHGLAYIMEL